MALRTTPTIAICLTAGLAAGIALARPGDDETPAAAAPPAVAEHDTLTSQITIEGFAFSGPTVVDAGSPIEVTNLDSAPHTVTADDGSFDTGDLAQNEVGVIIAPAVAGTYTFFCAIHPSMTGSITVE